ncbi:MAG: metallopeptidase [Verrucomicrobiales bacterium]
MKASLYSLVLLAASTSFSLGHSLPADDGEPLPKPAENVRIEHRTRQIEGWTVHVDVSLLSGEHEETGTLALRILEQRLNRIVMRLPAEPRKAMQKVPIYLDRAHPLGNAHFHPSKDWLVSHGYDPAMTEAVHITAANSLIRGASEPNLGSVVLHELAHAYHFQVLDFDHPKILKGYEVFCHSEKFDAVTYPYGRQRPHYGLMDHKEFFAEMTETFFAENNTFPFNRTELMLYHPETYQLMVEIWGVDVPEPRGKWSNAPTAWDLRMLATLKSQRGQHDEALALVAQAKKLEPKNERLDSLEETLLEAKKQSASQ